MYTKGSLSYAHAALRIVPILHKRGITGEDARYAVDFIVENVFSRMRREGVSCPIRTLDSVVQFYGREE
ncbi:hypothetical protein HYU23_01020 [Candidatus Woesearchaeota archaeon]|nr:hypothetical protein [Candidatus Woesearchaeota archaeon]